MSAKDVKDDTRDGVPAGAEAPVSGPVAASGQRAAGGVSAAAASGNALVVSCEVLHLAAGERRVLPYDFSQAKAVLLNGYQSWTLTAELPARARMRGLRGVPRNIVGYWALDGGGDYRFYPYSGHPGCQHGWTYGYMREAEGCLLVASVDEREGFTLIETDANAGTIAITREGAGDVALIRAQTLDAAFDAWAALMRGADIAALTAKPLVGYTSWYRHYANIADAALRDDLAGCARVLDGVDTTGCTRAFQIDDGYVAVGDWLSPRSERFPDGMAALARDIAGEGFVPGLWVSPFVCEKDSRLYAEHPDWLLREGDALVQTGCQWSGAFALDTQNPQVRAYVREVLRTITAEWGFGLLKLDFLFAACMVPHAGMNRGQLMSDAMTLIAESVAPGTLTLCCGVPLGSVFGRTQYCRVGCDVGLNWDDKLYMRGLHQERISTKNAIITSRARRQLNGRVFGSDADVFFLRDDVQLTQRQRTRLLETCSTCGSVLLTSDDMGAWDSGQLAAYARAVARLRECAGA